MFELLDTEACACTAPCFFSPCTLYCSCECVLCPVSNVSAAKSVFCMQVMMCGDVFVYKGPGALVGLVKWV